MLLVHLCRPDMAVDIRRDAYAGVTQYPADHLQFGACFQHLGGIEVSKPMRAERFDTRPEARPPQRLAEVPYLRVAANAFAGEHVGRLAWVPLYVAFQQFRRGRE